MNSRFKIWLPLILALVLITGIQIGFIISPSKYKPSFFGNHSFPVTDEVYELIKANYVDTVNDERLLQNGIEGMLSKLDPHTVYIPPVEQASLDEMLKGKFDGIGIEFYMLRDTLLILDVFKASPSERAGLMRGDRIIAVNDTIIAGKKIRDDRIFKMIRGAGGTNLKVCYLRNGKENAVVITRGSIPSPSIDAAYMINDNLGYIKLERFSATSYHEFMDAFVKLKDKGLKKLILDLRGNGGGLLDEATSIIDEFIDQGKIMVYTKGRVYGREDFKSRIAGVFEQGPLVLLIDEESASASEVIAGALQDYDRATIIGRRSFGKGLVQHQYKLSDGGYLRLTVAKYYTPSGRCIQKPYGTDHNAYYHEVLERKDTTSTFVPKDTTKYYTASGRVVYGGGGITPDIVVPESNALRQDALNEILDKGAIQDFAYDYASLHNDELLKSYPAANDFISHFNISNEIFSRFISSQKDPAFKTMAPDAEAFIKEHIIAYMARYLYGRDAFFHELGTDDPVLKRGVEEIEKKK